MHRPSPGPWRAEAIAPEDTYFQDVNILRPDGLAVAAAFQNGDISPEETWRNACVLAAAPDLLEALRDVMFAVEAWTNREIGPADLGDYLSAGRDAVAKAEGASMSEEEQRDRPLFHVDALREALRAMVEAEDGYFALEPVHPLTARLDQAERLDRARASARALLG